jgi:hypothetical protein
LKARQVFFALFILLTFKAPAESFRALIQGAAEVKSDGSYSQPVSLGFNGSALISLPEEIRFFKAVEVEISAPQVWLAYRGSLAMALYAELDKVPQTGVADLNARRIAYEPLPNKLQIVYQIPLRKDHGLKTSPYATLIPGPVLPGAFPAIFRIMPVIKGLSEELESIAFQVKVKPVFSDEGAVRLSHRYPPQLQDRPFTVLIDDRLIENPGEELFLKEGEHQLVVVSEDYRNENRRFVVERTKTLDLTIELQDPTPLIIFEGPENAAVYLDNTLIRRPNEAIPVEVGSHEARFQVGDYRITRVINVQRGKTYRVALTVDVDILESE